METLETKIQQNSAKKFYCKICHYGTMRKSNFDSHLISRRHIKGNQMETDSAKLSKIQQISNGKKYTCDNCNKEFINRSGLWKHNKTCNSENKIITTTKLSNNANENEIVTFLMKENGEFKQLLLDQNKQFIELSNKMGSNIFNNCNNNNNNKTFNLQVFLNETCKNAMNISDFAESIKLELSDLESVGELGYVSGISNIIIKNLKGLDITQRPFHCTDVKRETLYIKDKDKWEKEGEQKLIILKFVNNVANKNIRTLSEFKKKYPDCCKYESKYSDYYSKLIIEAMGGSGGTDPEKHEKIIKNICKEVTVDKTIL